MFSKLLKIAAALFVIVLLSNVAPANAQCVIEMGPYYDFELDVSRTYRPCDSDFTWAFKFHRNDNTSGRTTIFFQIRNGSGTSLVLENYNSDDYREGDYSFRGHAVDTGVIGQHTMTIGRRTSPVYFFKDIKGMADYR